MRRRNFRKKGGLAGDAVAEKDSRSGKFQGSSDAASKPKAKKNLLSFDEDEEPLVTLVRKPQDVRYSKKKDRGSLQPPPSTQIPSAGDYSKEQLSELQNATPRLPQPKKEGGASAGQEKEPVQSIIKLSGSFKPSKSTKKDWFEMDATGLVGEPTQKLVGSKESINLPPPPRSPQTVQNVENTAINVPSTGKSTTPSPAENSLSVPTSEDANLDDHFIPPDTKTIRLAKAKRERLRQAHLAPDYLPLGGASSLLSQDFKLKDMAKNSDSEEEAEEGMRMKFIGNPIKSKPRSTRHVSYDLDEQGEEGDDDKEADDEFVRAQIRKGIGQGNTLDDKPTRQQNTEPQSTADQDQLHLQHLTIPPLKSLLNNAVELRQIINRDLERLALSKKQAEQNLNRTRGFLRDALEDVGNLKASLELSGQKYVDVQQMKEYIADVSDCLQSKAVLIKELEDHMSNLMEERAEERKKAQMVRDAEDMKIAEASVSIALDALSKGGSPASAAIAADAAAEAAETSLASKLEGVDEFGRSLKLMQQSEITARGVRRKIRWAQVRQDSRNCAFDLEASSDDSDGETERFSGRCKEVVHTASSVFADADPAFGSLNGVRAHLEKWKRSNPSGYQASYMSTSVPALVAPFVRLEMLRWNPLIGGEVALDKQHWYYELENYGQSGNEQSAVQDEDQDLIPVLVSKIVLPIASQLINRCWSPFSLPQTRAVAEILREILVYVPANNPKLHELLSSVTNLLSTAVEPLQLPPWPQAAVNVSASAEATINIRFRRSLRLMKGICCFGDLLPQPLLRKLLLDTLIGKVLLGFLHGGVGDAAASVERLSVILNMLPRAWFSGGPPREAPYLMDLVSATARAMESQRVEAMAEGNLGITKSAKRLADLQTLIGDVQGATRIRQSFHVTRERLH